MNTRLVRHDVHAMLHADGADPTQAGGLTICVQTSEMDRVLAALTIANGAAAMGVPARLYFAFWGVTVLARCPNPDAPFGRRLFARLVCFVTRTLKLPKLDFFGLGPMAMRWRMRQQDRLGVDEHLAMAREMGVELFVCDATLDMFGMKPSDLDPALGFELCGVSTFVDHALSSKQTLFI